MSKVSHNYWMISYPKVGHLVYLKLDGNRVKFEFPPRKAAAGAREFPVVEGVVAICPKPKRK